MTRLLAALVVLTLLLVATSCCTPADHAGLAPLAGELTVPAPFALQFVGSYAADRPTSLAAGWLLQLHRDGSYDFFPDDGSGSEHGGSEHGAFFASPSRELPLSLRGATWTANVTAYDSRLHMISNERSATLRALQPVGPVEALCDATEGIWTDDDPEGATGLYCVCPPPTVYLPSAGGCER